MANYSQRLRLTAPVVNGDFNTWGDEINTDIGLIDDAVTGVAYVSLTGQSSVTLTANDGASDQSRYAGLVLTGTLTAACVVYVPASQKFTWIYNKTTGSFAVTVQVVNVTTGSVVTVPQSATWTMVYCDGVNCVSVSGGFGDKFPDVSTPTTLTDAQIATLESLLLSNGQINPTLIEMGSTGLNIWTDNGGASATPRVLIGPPSKSIAVDNVGNLVIPGNVTSSGNGQFNTLTIGPNNTAILPITSIIMWFGIAANIPNGWVICDGNNGTPNLLGSVIAGAANDQQVGAGTGSNDAQDIGSALTMQAAGLHTHNITVQNAGQHNHGGATGSYALQAADLPSHSHGVYGAEFSVGSGSGSYYALGTSGSNSVYTQTQSDGGAGGSHTHAINEDGTHTHAATNDDQGSHTHTLSGSISVMQQTVFLYFIMRIK